MTPTRISELREVFVAHSARLELYARFLAPRDIAPELVQEAFVRLMEHEQRHAGPPRDDVAWLFRVVRNLARDAARRMRPRPLHATDLGLVASPGSPLSPSDIDIIVASLDEPLREVLVLRLWSGMTLQQVSNVTGIPITTVHRRYAAAVAAARAALEQTRCTPTNLAV